MTMLNYPFRHEGRPFPSSLASGADLVRAQIKTGLAMPRRGGYVHVPDSTVVGWQGARLRFACHWLCGSSSTDAMAVTIDQIRDEQRCAACADAALGPAVYRFSSDDELLYIGSDERYLVRRGQHVTGATWWSSVTREQVTRYPTLLEARIAEQHAIRAEHPKFNRMRFLKAVA